jgi:diguanylate cyclase (GGDEF)-like protein
LVRAYDYVGRYGGEEFIILAQQLSAETVFEYADRIRAALANMTVMHEERQIAVTVSIGIAFVERLQRHSPDAMMRMADDALYAAKKQGRNCVSVDSVSQPSEFAVHA